MVYNINKNIFEDTMLTIDFVGRVNNTPLSPRQALLPLFEAIFNSIHAIQDAGIDNGFIEISIKRDDQNLLPTDDEQNRLSPIIEFTIIDNGIGFTQENYDSFCRSDSQKKSTIGGKGVGRFLWLKAFEEAHISSIFDENGIKFKRTFTFALLNDPILNPICDKIYSTDQNKTSVTLTNPKIQFSNYIPRNLEIIAYRIVEHCLEFFVLDLMPKISISDGVENIDLNDYYSSMVSNSETDEFEIEGSKFSLIHFLLIAHPGMGHQINYCAGHRVVEYKKIDSKTIQNLPSKIQSSEDNDEGLIYMGYLSGSFLDSHVNQQRSGFDSFSVDQIEFIGEIRLNDLEEKVINAIRIFLQPITDPIGRDKILMVENYIKQDAPEYKSLLRFRQEAINDISPDTHPEKLDLELYKAQKKWDVELKETANEIVNSQLPIVQGNNQEVEEKYLRFLEEWNENGKTTLAKYIVHRKTTLEILEKNLQKTDDGGYAREKTIHQMIFPLRSTSDDISYEQQNLWVIDEKLAFHAYLASDLELKQISGLSSEDLDRPDLLIFDNPMAVVDAEPSNGVTIFEFKRPMRKDSNPISQMFDYVRKIRDGKELTNRGRPIYVNPNTPFNCYAICDLSNELRQAFETIGMVKTPDGEGYFIYNPNYCAYAEVISYNKLIRTAKNRNRILFEKMNIPY